MVGYIKYICTRKVAIQTSNLVVYIPEEIKKVVPLNILCHIILHQVLLFFLGYTQKL